MKSGYTAMWQADKSPQAQSRLENLKELVRFMHEFDTLEGFLEHVSLVMDTEQAGDGQKVSVMTLHAAKGLEFEVVFLPGWEEGLFPHQRSLDESGQAGLEEERRLAYVGLTRARRIAKVSFAQNRRNRGLYQSALPSRFVDELPEAHVEVAEPKMPFGGAYQNFGGTFGRGGYGRSRFDDARAVRGHLRHARLAARPGAHQGADEEVEPVGSAQGARAADHRGRAGRRIERERRLQARRARAAPEVRRRHGDRRRRQQADDRIRRGRPQARRRQLRRA